MTAPREPADVPALALTVAQAAAALGVAENHFRQHVLPHVRTIKVGRVRIVPVIELERWLYLKTRASATRNSAELPRPAAHDPR